MRKKTPAIFLAAFAALYCLPALAGNVSENGGPMAGIDGRLPTGKDGRLLALGPRVVVVEDDCDGRPCRRRGRVDVDIDIGGAADDILEWESSWGGGGGPMLSLIHLDLDCLHPMTKERGVDDFDDQMLLVGGLGGWAHNNFHAGLMGFGMGQDEDGRVNGHTRTAEIALGGGMYFQYDIPLLGPFGVHGGSMIGAGGMWFSACGRDLGPDKSWAAYEGFFMAYPYAGVWANPSPFLRTEIDVGYMFFDIDTDSTEFLNDLDRPMVDGDIQGGVQISFKALFGYYPAR